MNKWKKIKLLRGKVKKEVRAKDFSDLFESIYSDKDNVWKVRFMSKKELPKIINIEVRYAK